jgi:uncharacterized membrane protein
MTDLVAIEFPSEARAEEVRQKLLDLQPDYVIELEDAVIAVKQPNGRVKLNQLFHPAAAGAAFGTLWGVIMPSIYGADRGCGAGCCLRRTRRRPR